MRPGLTIQRILSTDQVDAARIDDGVRSMAETVNGGLTGQNLAQTYKLGVSQFYENKSVYTLCASSISIVGANSSMICVVPVASRVISLGYNLTLTSDGEFSSGVSIQAGTGSSAYLYTPPFNNIAYATFPPASSYASVNYYKTTATIPTPWPNKWATGTIFFDQRSAALSAGALISFATFPVSGGSFLAPSWDGSIVWTLATSQVS
jgi:hypothetical protein